MQAGAAGSGSAPEASAATQPASLYPALTQLLERPCSTSLYSHVTECLAAQVQPSYVWDVSEVELLASFEQWLQQSTADTEVARVAGHAQAELPTALKCQAVRMTAVLHDQLPWTQFPADHRATVYIQMVEAVETSVRALWEATSDAVQRAAGPDDVVNILGYYDALFKGGDVVVSLLGAALKGTARVDPGHTALLCSCLCSLLEFCNIMVAMETSAAAAAAAAELALPHADMLADTALHYG